MFGCGPMVNYNRVYDFSKDFLLYLWKIPICQTVPNCHIVLLLIDQKEISIDSALENNTNWFVLFICFLRKWWKNPKIWTACNCIQSDIKKSTEWEIKIYIYIYIIYLHIYIILLMWAIVNVKKFLSFQTKPVMLHWYTGIGTCPLAAVKVWMLQHLKISSLQ